MENGNQNSQQPTTSPRIYVACLASYSSGILHGVWIAADQDPADIYAEIRSMLAKSREPFAEEFGIHDYQGNRQPRVKMHAKTESMLFQEDTDNFRKYSVNPSQANALRAD